MLKTACASIDKLSILAARRSGEAETSVNMVAELSGMPADHLLSSLHILLVQTSSSRATSVILIAELLLSLITFPS
jgi:hypothetical protein